MRPTRGQRRRRSCSSCRVAAVALILASAAALAETPAPRREGTAAAATAAPSSVPTPMPPPTSPLEPLTLSVLRPPRDPAAARRDNARALRLLRRGALAEAEALLAQAHRADPLDAEVATNWGSVLGRLGRGTEAERAFQAALAADPARWLAYTGLAELWAEASDRWHRREPRLRLLLEGLERVHAQRRARLQLGLRLASFQRAVGWTAEARQRLLELGRHETLAPAERRRWQQVLDAIERDEQVLALEDWPPPRLEPAVHRLSAQVERLAARGARREALDLLGPLLRDHPDAPELRWQRARMLLALGRHDEATADLNVLVQLAPSRAVAWRLLGTVLADYGGRGELERALVALGRSLALDPSTIELWLVRGRVLLRLGREAAAADALERFRRAAPAHAQGAAARSLARALAQSRGSAAARLPPVASAREPDPPAPEVRALFAEAQRLIEAGADPEHQAEALLAQVLAQAPAFLEAALAYFALTGTVLQATVDALWSAPQGLFALVRGVLELAAAAPADDGATAPMGALDRRVAVRARVAPWIDRLVALGQSEARFDRAVLRQAAGDAAGALEDLRRYVAQDPPPPRLAEANALRVALGHSPVTDEARVRYLLARDRAGEAIELLGGACTPGLPVARLALLADAFAYGADLPRAAQCYRLVAERARPALVARAERALARLAARATPALRGALRPALVRAAARGVTLAEWPLALLARAAGAPETAVLAHLARLFSGGALDEPLRAEANALREALRRQRDARHRRQRRVLWALAAAVALALVAWAARRYRGLTLAGALARCPTFYPELAELLGRVRHDVIKHRASALSALRGAGADHALRGEVAAALTQPEAASMQVARLYAELGQQAKARGLRLRALVHEPVLGPLQRDLLRAERLLRGEGPASALLRLDEAIRGRHLARLAALLARGPRTRVDAALLMRWARALQAERAEKPGAAPAPWIDPQLEVALAGTEFPLDAGDLYPVFANLLRNAQTAVAHALPPAEAAGAALPIVVVRVRQEHDALGQRVVVLAVADSAATTLSAEAIETRAPGRGLAIARELVRRWRGTLTVEPQPAPLTKALTVRFFA